MIAISKSSDVPKKPHFCIILYKTIQIPGYDIYDPPANEVVAIHLVSTSKDEWSAKVEELTLNKKDFVAFEVPKLAEVKVSVSVR